MTNSNLVRDLDRLHAGYIAAVNAAVADDNTARAGRLAAEYDVAAIRVMAEHEGRPDLVQTVIDARNARAEGRVPDSRLRRRLAQLGTVRAA